MGNDVLFYGLTIFLFILMSAFFSAAETALTAVTRARLYQLVMSGNKRAEIASKLRREKESLIGTVLLGNNTANIAASALATSLAVSLVGNNEMGIVLVTLVMTFLIVIFAEILPKTYAIQNAETVAMSLAPALNLIVKLLYPITYSIQWLIRGMLKLFGIDITKSNTLISVTDLIRGTIELHHSEGRMVKQERDMLGSILDLGEIEVKDIMIHRTKTETLDADLPASRLIMEAVATLHSRLPLWRTQPDNIIGLLHVKDLIKAMGENPVMTNETILSIAHKPWFIPETTRLRDQLLAFRSRRRHFAFVVDEYGAWQGIVTLEDLIEEIVGDIGDEHDEANSDIQPLGHHAYLVTGSLSVRDLNRRLDWNLPDEEASTVAGLLIHAAEKLPAVDEHFDINGFRFTVVAKDAAQLTRLKIEKLPEDNLQAELPL